LDFSRENLRNFLNNKLNSNEVIYKFINQEVSQVLAHNNVYY
jgi:hypothetical protein